MSSDIAALAPSAPPVAASRPDPADMVRPDVPEISFDELWSDKTKGFTFSDLLDIVNPLQHLPVIGTIYRAITGDEISLGARIAGGALYGGPVGVMSEAAQAAADQAVGGDAGGKLLAFVGELFGGDDSATQLAKVEPAAGAANAAAPASDASKVDKPEIVKSIGSAAADPNAVLAAPGAVPVLVSAGQEMSVPPAAVPAASPAPHPVTGAAPASAPRVATQPLRDFPAFPRPRPAASRGVMMPLRPGLGGEQMMPLRPGLGAQGGARMMPLVPGAASGAQPSDKSAAGPRADAKPADAESKRIADQIAAAQRAQTGLLLASLAGSATAPSRGLAGGDNRSKDADRSNGPADPFRSHAMPLPPGASTTWISRAMEQALTRYQRSQQLQPGSPASAAKDPAAGAASSNAAPPPTGN